MSISMSRVFDQAISRPRASGEHGRSTAPMTPESAVVPRTHFQALRFSSWLDTALLRRGGLHTAPHDIAGLDGPPEPLTPRPAFEHAQAGRSRCIDAGVSRCSLSDVPYSPQPAIDAERVSGVADHALLRSVSRYPSVPTANARGDAPALL